MSELQTEVAEVESTEPQAETVDSGADLATDSQGQDETNVQNSESENFQKSINRVTAQKYEQKRRADEAERQLNEIKQKEQEAQLNLQAPEIPPIPDVYEMDEDAYRKALTERDVAIQRKSQFDAQQMYIRQANEQQRQLAQQQQQIANQETTDKFKKNAVNQGIDSTELTSIANTLVSAGLDSNPDLTMHIMAQDDGALIMKHLSENLGDLDQLMSTSNPYQAAAILDSVKAKAAALKPKQSQAPDPTPNIGGGGVDSGGNKHPALEGVIYS